MFEGDDIPIYLLRSNPNPKRLARICYLDEVKTTCTLTTPALTW